MTNYVLAGQLGETLLLLTPPLATPQQSINFASPLIFDRRDKLIKGDINFGNQAVLLSAILRNLSNLQKVSISKPYLQFSPLHR
jgi:hypothetical protein